MAGGSLAHALIVANLGFLLIRETRANGNDCRAFTSELKVEVSEGSRYVYPDASVVCPKPNESHVLKGSVRNPKVVVEVISPSSAGYDQGAKRRYYFFIPSVEEYLLVEQDSPVVTLYRRRKGDDLYRIITIEGLEETIELTSINVELTLKEIYQDVDFTTASK